MSRETTIAAYHRADATGLIQGIKLKVLAILAEHGPMTANEMRKYGDPNANSGVYGTRLSELKRMGVVQEVGERPCETTGYSAIEWDLTGNLPVKPPKEKTKRELKKEILDDIAALGKVLPMTYKGDLREIHRKLRKSNL